MIPKFVSVLIFLGVLSTIQGQTCQNPRVETTGFTTQDARILSHIAYISEFTLTCSNDIKDIPLYAEIDGTIATVARSMDGQHYQVSWLEPPETAISGTRSIKLYDEQGYATFRKSQRSGEDSSTITPLATISLYHPGAYRGPWIQSETLAVFGAIGVFYYAFSQRSIIVA